MKEVNEAIEESFGLEKIRENAHSLSTAFLSIFDNGLPLLGNTKLFLLA